MKQIIKSLLYLSMSFLFVSCQEDVHDRRLEFNELPSVKSKELVVLIDNDDFVVLTTTDVFNKMLGKWVRNYKIGIDKKLLEAIKAAETGKPVIVRADSIAQSVRLERRMDLLTADLIQANKCLVYNKRSMQLERLVHVEGYSSDYSGGRKFFVKRKLILKVMDWIA